MMAHGKVRITEMYAYVVVDPADDTEGVPAFAGPDGMMMPLVGADTVRAEALRPVAQRMATQMGVTVELVRFTVRESIETLQP